MDPFLNFMQGETRFLQQQEVTLDCPGGSLEMLTQPGTGDLLLLHEDPEDLAKADHFCLRASITAHHVFTPLLKEKLMSRK
jgi:hypothetical protein